MNRKSVFSILLILLMMACDDASNETINRIDGTSIPLAQLEKRIEVLMEEAKVTGLALSIFNQNKAVYQKAFGYADLQQRQHWISITSFTAPHLVRLYSDIWLPYLYKMEIWIWTNR